MSTQLFYAIIKTAVNPTNRKKKMPASEISTSIKVLKPFKCPKTGLFGYKYDLTSKTNTIEPQFTFAAKPVIFTVDGVPRYFSFVTSKDYVGYINEGGNHYQPDRFSLDKYKITTEGVFVFTTSEPKELMFVNSYSECKEVTKDVGAQAYKVSLSVRNRKALIGYTYVNKRLDILYSEFDDRIYEFSDTHCLIKDRHSNNFGLALKNFHLRIPMNYQGIVTGIDDQFIVTTRNGKQLIGPKGHPVMKETYNQIKVFDENHYLVKFSRHRIGLINTSGKVVFNHPCTDIESFEEENYFFSYFGKIGILNPDFSVLIEPFYERILPQSNGFRPVRYNNKWGILGPDGIETTLCQYPMVRMNNETKMYEFTLKGVTKVLQPDGELE